MGLVRLLVAAGAGAVVPLAAVATLADGTGSALAASGGVVLSALGLAAWQEDRLARAEDASAHTARAGRDLAGRLAMAENAARDQAILAENLPDPLIVLGADRQVRQVNRACRTLLGSDLSVVLRQPSLRAALDRVLAQGVAEGAAQGAVQTAELALTTPVRRSLQATVFALGTDRRLVILLSDRTRERAVEQMRADFVANASHELRTPLASLTGFIETLQGPAHDDPPARDRFLAIMADQAARMRRLIDDLLSLSRIELTEHQPPAGLVDLSALAAQLAPSFEPQLAARRIRLDLALDTALPPVPGDEGQLGQVLQNLLDNAVKYGREAGTVRMALQRATPGGSTGTGRTWPARSGAVLSVSDDGQGIPRDHLPRLTERFYRVDKGRSRAVGGTGLGLAIVKHIVSRHGGQLAIASEENAGTTVTIWLPVSPEPAATENKSVSAS